MFGILLSNLKNNTAIIKGVNGLFNPIATSTDVANRISEVCKGNVGQVSEEMCANAPEELLKLCKKDKNRDCDTLIREGVEIFCKENSESPACDWLPTTSTTSGSDSLPFIIGGIVALVIILAVGAGLFFYCRNKKKKSAGNGQTMTGTTVGSTSATGTTKTGTTATETGSRY
ncbi:hypothetical protein GCK72_004514 [Caenorhabditis remanei]|uniref:Uncharacterized protein n=1 Tax=Caenorhabditis remanei TaxID=31234 RepID=A0A6A5HBE7_CAERE|nr:hypothetical protein GCK72_004514 [Caenorhabditis remanei]KAF1764565.1 hypothetical protein GCK72_004514 [Caenorhabditis remanei]